MMRNLNLTLSIFILLLIFVSACNSSQTLITSVNLNKARGIRAYSNMYSLPKTVIRVNVKVIRTQYKKGPYHNYAKTYLGLTNVIKQDRECWEITDVKFENYSVVDTSQIYLLEGNSELNKLELELTKNGFLKAIYPNVKEADYKSFPEFDIANATLPEILNEVSCNVLESKQLSFDDVALPGNVITKRTEREQAVELSKKILSMREDRAAIIVGDGYTEAMPDGGALKIMIDKIDLIHEKYISMFEGRIKKDTYRYSFDFIPEDARKVTQSILFRFSNENGIVETTDMSGVPVILEIESHENLRGYGVFRKNQTYLKLTSKDKKEAEGLFYRIPESGTVKLLINEKVLDKKDMQISQFGVIQPLSSEYLNGKYAVQFYPDLGTIKSIKRYKIINTQKKK